MNFDIKRIVLYVVFAFFASQLWVSWQKDVVVVNEKAAVANAKISKLDVPTINTAPQQGEVAVVADNKTLTSPYLQDQPAPFERLVWVDTDVLRVAIDTKGGNVVRAYLLHYPEKGHTSKDPIQILDDTPGLQYIAQSGLISKSGPDNTQGQAQWQTLSQKYTLAPGDKELDVRLSWKDTYGVMVDKIFTFKRGEYLIDMRYNVDNRSSQTWNGNFYTQFKRKDVTPKKQGMFYINPYRGGSYSSPGDKLYNKLSFSKMTKSNLDVSVTGGWAAMQQHYFLSAWIPEPDAKLHYYSKAPLSIDGDKKPQYFILGMYSDAIAVAPNTSHSVGSKLYVGPEQTVKLKSIAPGLEMTVDYGLLWPISILIMWMMRQIHHVVANWGWSILIVTLFIKLMFYHLSATTYKSMARQKELAPRIEQLRTRFGDDKSGFSQEMIALYRREKVNPLGGCLPMVVQIPVFIALYWVLVESVEFRQAPFILWIHDLSMPDPFYLLPLVMGLTMFVQQKLNPPPPDPMQRKMLMALPVVFTVLFLYFPAGLVLYFAANNALSVLQQWYVMRKINTKRTAAPVVS